MLTFKPIPAHPSDDPCDPRFGWWKLEGYACLEWALVREATAGEVNAWVAAGEPAEWTIPAQGETNLVVRNQIMKPTGYILYDGPSQLDGMPIVVIATGFGGSANRKTGAMIQTWIMRADISPIEAFRAKEDSSVCGNCPHRWALGGNCYVNIGQAPLAVWRAYKRGSYPQYDGKALAGKLLRIGSYGDPAAVPFETWQEALKDAAGNTGYTHQWRTCDKRFASVCMASCDSFSDWCAAESAGWRTFLVTDVTLTGVPNTVVCPASKEAGAKLQCSQCRACCGTGTGRKSHIQIMAH